MQKITNTAQLRESIKQGNTEYFILLNGNIRSSKDIFLDENDTSNSQKFLITNCIDDSEQDLTEEELYDTTKSNIGEAIKNDCFYMY